MPITTNRYTEDYLQPYAGYTGRTIAIKIKASTYVEKGAFLSQVAGSPGTFEPTLTTVPGSPTLINKRQIMTDANGNVTFGSPATGMDQGQVYTHAEAYYAGVFNTADLPQSGPGAIQTAYVQSGSGRAIGMLLSGTTANGLIQIY